MKGELCRVMTSDRLELQGLLVSPPAGPTDTSLLHIHGLAGNFYENRFIDAVAEAVTAGGIGFLAINNRGRDYLSDFIQEQADGALEYKQIGGIYEIFEECLQDIQAWVVFLKSRGYRRIILQGHSHGALKATYYLYRSRQPEVAGLILLSPSDDFGCQRKGLGERFSRALGVAGQMMKEGRGRDLMPGEYFHYPVSADTYFNIFNRGSSLKMFNLSGSERHDFRELQAVRVPVLVTVGSVDEAFVGAPADYVAGLKARLGNAKGFTSHVIEGAPHNYLGYEESLAQHIADWLLAEYGP